MKLKVEQRVWYTKAKKKAVVKELLPSGLIRITYFDPQTDKRQVKDVLQEELKPFRKKSKKRFKKQFVIKVKYFNDIEKLKKIEQGEWIDLRAAEDVELKAGEYKLIPLGIAMKLPYGYEANIVPRSSTFKNWGILQTNSYGVIDNSYNGDDDQWMFPAYATRDTIIKKNDRICQFRIQRTMPKVKIIEVSKLHDKNRGGFGSTGKN